MQGTIAGTVFRDIDAVIFDLDGSLVDSMWLWRAIDIEYLGKFGIALPENLQSCIEGMSFSETADYFKSHFPIPDSVEQMKNDWNRMAWDKYTYEVPLKPGALAFIESCKRQGVKLGIASSNSRELVEQVISVHGLQNHFDFLVSGCDVKRGKPHPEGYLLAAEGLGVLPERCLAFEDIPAGIQAARSAGMKVCAVEDAYSAHCQEKKREMADFYIDDYDAILIEEDESGDV